MSENNFTNYEELLSFLVTFEKESEDNDASTQKILDQVVPLLSEKDKDRVNETWKDSIGPSNIHWKYLLVLTFAIERIKEKLTKDKIESPLSLKQTQSLRKAMEKIASIGLKPNCLLFDESKGKEKSDLLKRQKRLVFAANFLTSCSDVPALKPALSPHFGIILRALVFLSHAQFCPPKSGVHDKKQKRPERKMAANNHEFFMTPELFSQLKEEQREFEIKLEKMIDTSPLVPTMRELMVIHGTEKYPKFMHFSARKYLIRCIMKPSGVLSLIEAMCNDQDYTDLGKHWNTLQVAGRLLAASYPGNRDKYYDAISSQLIDMLRSSEKRKGIKTIANCCISALWEFNADLCTRKIFARIAAPFLLGKEAENVVPGATLYDESEVSESIEILVKCFVADDLKGLPNEMLMLISLPLFCLHRESYKSISALRGTVKRLVQNILSQEESHEQLFSAFLGYSCKWKDCGFGREVSFQLGSSGGFRVVEKEGKAEAGSFEERADALFDAVYEDKVLSSSLFNFLLARLENESPGNVNLDVDVMVLMEQHLAAVNLLRRLASTSNVQSSTFEKPASLLSFVESLLARKKKDSEPAEDVDVDYIGLMLIKVILTERNTSRSSDNWEPFEEFIEFLDTLPSSVLSGPSKSILDDVKVLVKTKGRRAKKQYKDLSVNGDEKQSDFEKALEDLANPLLPIRGHGLIALTKLIENEDNETIAKKDVLICLFQENLKHEDSFLYLSAINGLCALANRFPESVIELLIQEFVDMPERAIETDISPENRAKIGEILVKATRALGEMAPKYKTPLVNGFLCAARDPDPLVRASSLSCLGELCKILGFRLGNLTTEILYCIGCIVRNDKNPECRRAAVLVATMLLRGLGKDVLCNLGSDLVTFYKAMKYLRDNDADDVTRLHAQLALEEIDDIVKNELFAKPKLEKTIFLLSD